MLMFKGTKTVAGCLLCSVSIATLAMVACCSAAQAATTLSFTSSFLTDASQPFSGNAVFTYTGLGTMTVKLTDTTVDPVSDAPNIADLSFVIAGLTTGSVTGASGQTIASIVDGTTPTLGNYSGAPLWQLTNATSGWWTQVYAGSSHTFDLYAPASVGGAAGCMKNTAPYSIVGSPSSNGTYTNPNNLSGPGVGSANLLTSGCDGTMFYESATFNLSIAGLNATNFAQITNVGFGLGPDAANKPDRDDVSAGLYTAVPEPATWAMFLIGFGGIGFMMRSSRRKGAVATV
jgi:hypothetical protein